jgi:hypothetical protein
MKVMLSIDFALCYSQEAARNFVSDIFKGPISI